MVGAVTKGQLEARLDGAITDTLDAFAEIGRVTRVLFGHRTQMVQIVAVRKDTARADRLVFETDDLSGFVVNSSPGRSRPPLLHIEPP